MRDYALNRPADFDEVTSGSFIRRIVRNWLARQSVAKLENLNDDQLLDIGLYRSDLRWAEGLSLTINPEFALKKRIAVRGRQGLPISGERLVQPFDEIVYSGLN